MSAIALNPFFDSINSLGSKAMSFVFGKGGLAVAIGALAALGAIVGVSSNFLFFALSLTGFAIALSTSLRNAAFYSLVFLCFKSALWRLAFHLDFLNQTQPTVDLFRFSAGLYLSALCMIVIAKRLIENRKTLQHKLDITIALFIGVYVLAIVNPHNSPLAGLAGFERTIFPTVMVFFLAGEVIHTKKDIIALTKIIAITTLVTALYGLKHAISGIWGFETTAFNDLFGKHGFDGWLTIGIKGVEFRTFSTFFGYMEFTFTLALWGALLIGDSFVSFTKGWRVVRWLTIVALIVLLSLSLERTPILMIIAGLLTTWYVRSEKKRRLKIALVSAFIVVTITSGITLFERELEASGIAKLERIAELGDPTKAASIQDRVDRMWLPTLKIIAANPLGVGAGFGSQTFLTSQPTGSGFQTQPHNEILQKTLEAGWLAGILFGVIIVLLFRELKSLSETTTDKDIKRYTALGCGIVVAFAFCGQINLPFSGPQGTFFWFVSGALISVARHWKHNQEEQLKISGFTHGEQS